MDELYTSPNKIPNYCPKIHRPRVLEYLKDANLRQYPPRTRMMWFRYKSLNDWHPVYLKPIKFQWLSFGHSKRWRSYMVFGHDRAWEDLDDAIETLRCLNNIFHSGYVGHFCPGDYDTKYLKSFTVEELFFHTVNTCPHAEFPDEYIESTLHRAVNWNMLDPGS